MHSRSMPSSARWTFDEMAVDYRELAIVDTHTKPNASLRHLRPLARAADRRNQADLHHPRRARRRPRRCSFDSCLTGGFSILRPLITWGRARSPLVGPLRAGSIGYSTWLAGSCFVTVTSVTNCGHSGSCGSSGNRSSFVVALHHAELVLVVHEEVGLAGQAFAVADPNLSMPPRFHSPTQSP
jgi:hypothetical protein